MQWGAWHGVGMVAASAAVLQRMARAGVASLAPATGLSTLTALLSTAQAPPQVLLCYLYM